MQPTPLLSVRDLRVEFTTRRATLVALDGVSFDIHAGEIVGLVGESGAGKSVTGAAIIGLIEPPGAIASGTIHLGDRRIDNLGPGQWPKIRGRRIGMVFQDPATSLNPVMRIGKQLCETIRTHRDCGAPVARARAIELLEQVGIPAAARRIDAYPHELSGGMRQRVVIALVLAAEPDLIVADEPTTALDVSVQAQIIRLLRSLARERGTAILLITHDIGVIAETADRVAVMYAGRIAEIGPVVDVLRAPRHPYTIGLMGAIPSLTSTLGSSSRLVQIPGSMPRLSARPPGCAFSARCPRVVDRCRRERPDPVAAGSSAVACWQHTAGSGTAVQPAGSDVPAPLGGTP